MRVSPSGTWRARQTRQGGTSWPRVRGRPVGAKAHPEPSICSGPVAFTRIASKDRPVIPARDQSAGDTTDRGGYIHTHRLPTLVRLRRDLLRGPEPLWCGQVGTQRFVIGHATLGPVCRRGDERKGSLPIRLDVVEVEVRLVARRSGCTSMCGHPVLVGAGRVHDEDLKAGIAVVEVISVANEDDLGPV